MKLKIELCLETEETEIIIRCSRLTPEIQRIERALDGIDSCGITFFRGTEEFYLSLDKVLFFETDDKSVKAHTADDSFEVKQKLYELETALPKRFVRVSKSAILNVDCVYSVERSLTSASLVKFADTHKRIYISRGYYKNFKTRILERRGNI